MSKRIFAIFFLFLSVISVLQAGALRTKSDQRITYTSDGFIEEAFVTFATSNYFPLLEVLLDSVAAFSERGIVVFGVNADVPFSTKKYPFMIKKRIDVSSLSMMEICAAKPKAILEAGILRGVYLDTDIILNKDCDLLFKQVDENANHPRCCIFPWLVDNMSEFMKVLGVSKKSMPYVHAPLIVFHENSLPFINEWYFTCLNPSYQPLLTCHDETALNVLLWKYQVDDYINLCDPYYKIAYDYLYGGTDNHIEHGYINWIGKIDFYTFHGGKNPEECKIILKKLIRYHKNLRNN